MVLAAKRKSLVHGGKGNKPQATKSLTNAEEESFFASGQFWDHSPEGHFGGSRLSTSGSEQEMKAGNCVGVMCNYKQQAMAKKCLFG